MSNYLSCNHPVACQYDVPVAEDKDGNVVVTRKACAACERGGWVYVSEGLPHNSEGSLLLALCNGRVRSGGYQSKSWSIVGGARRLPLEAVYAWIRWPDPPPLEE